MKVAVVTCAYGPAALARMTERWWHGLKACEGEFLTGIVCQGLAPLSPRVAPTFMAVVKENEGFARGMNRAIRMALVRCPDLDRVIICNNDCTFPQTNWLERLHSRCTHRDAVVMPLNDKCNTGAMVQFGPVPEGRLISLPFGPAVCWSVATNIVAAIRKFFGYELFDPDFQYGWAEDNYAAAVIRKITGIPHPFIVEERSWIHHQGSVTVNHVIQKQNGIAWTKRNEALLSRKSENLAKLRIPLLRHFSEPSSSTATPETPTKN